MSKKATYFIFFVIVLCIGYSLYYFNQYDIKNDVSTQSDLKDWLNREVDGGEINPHVIDVVQLGHSTSYVALFQLENDNIGYAQLIKGWNGRFKIERAGYGTNVVSYEEIKTNLGMYGIVVGKNPDLKIDHITTKLNHENFSFTFKVADDKRFLKYKKLPSDLKQTFPADSTFYDENNNIIHLTGGESKRIK